MHSCTLKQEHPLLLKVPGLLIARAHKGIARQKSCCTYSVICSSLLTMDYWLSFRDSSTIVFLDFFNTESQIRNADKCLYISHFISYQSFLLLFQSLSVLHMHPRENVSIHLYAHNMIYCHLTRGIKCNLSLMLYWFRIYHVKDIKLVSCF